MPTGLKNCPAGGIPSVHQITIQPSVVKESGNLWWIVSQAPVQAWEEANEPENKICIIINAIE